MYSGKTTELIRRVEREQIAGKQVVVSKWHIDNRYGPEQYVFSHNGQKFPAFLVGSFQQLQEVSANADVLGIEEVQFFPPGIQNIIDSYVLDGKIVICAGLDATYRREPFGIMPELIAIADKIDKYTAVCHKCGADAPFTQRLIGGEPAPFNGPTVLVGAKDTYEARCRICFQAA